MDKNTHSTCGCSARFSLVGGWRGFVAACGLAGALSASATAQPTPQRAAMLLPPQAVPASEAGPRARGAIDDLPKAFNTSAQKPAPRPTPPANTNGPSWLTVDPNVQPASGIGPNAPHPVANKPAAAPDPQTPRPVQPVVREEVPRTIKPVEKPKTQVAPDRLPPTESVPETPNANTPFRSTTPNGAPVYAGPPAYRWYGYGSVTPGANPYAPTGQYPRASANWYSVTGATPGAFPVPVMNPLRSAPGSEPPNYATLPTTRYPGPMAVAPPAPMMPQVTTVPTPPVNAAPSMEGMKFETLPPSTAEPPRLGPTPPVAAPMIEPRHPTPISTPAPPEAPLVPPPQTGSVVVPTISSPPMMDPAPPMELNPRPVTPVEPQAVIPLPPPTGLVPSMIPEPSAPNIPAQPLMPPSPTATMTPTAPVAPVGPVAPALPTDVAPPTPPESPVPPKLTLPVFPPPGASNDIRWQPGEAPKLPEGTWTPVPGSSRQSALPAVVARGQSDDARAQPDPLGDLIRSMCQGRANSVEIRWTGMTSVTVCFEAPNPSDASRLVQDICSRPELVPIQIDFCVVVK